MLAYSTTKPREDGPILSNPSGTRPILPLDVTLSSLKGLTLRRHAKLARNKMGHASAATVNLNRPYSTVTDLARLRGWSTSVPMKTAA